MQRPMRIPCWMESGDKSPHSKGRRPGRVTTLLASVGRCSQPETKSYDVSLVATTELVSVERCFQFRLARRVGGPGSPVWEHHPTRTSRAVVGGRWGKGRDLVLNMAPRRQAAGWQGLNSEGPHRLRALIVDFGKVQANVSLLRPGPVPDLLAVLLR